MLRNCLFVEAVYPPKQLFKTILYAQRKRI